MIEIQGEITVIYYKCLLFLLKYQSIIKINIFNKDKNQEITRKNITP
jgi:hypothetical protein